MNISNGMYQGGVAILVRGEMQDHIEQIERIGRMILEIISSAKNAVSPIAALAAYAPRIGYTVGAGDQHMTLARETIGGIPATDLRILRADANGQLGRAKETTQASTK